MWIPDVYHGAATPTTLLVGGAPKVAAFAFIMRLLATALPSMAADWSQMLVILAVASMFLGNVVAIAQSNLKRMLAYSTISHMGFVMMGILAATETGYGAAMFYVLAYTIMGSRAALRAVFRGRYFRARLTIDGAVHERRAAAVMIANFGAVLGNRITLGPEIRTDDGLLDACVFSPNSFRDALRKAGFYAEWKKKYGDEAWGILEKAVGSSLS